MKKKTLLILLPILSFSLSSCGEVYKYSDHLQDYVFTMEYHKNFNILQLTDIHWNGNTSTADSSRYLDKVIKETDRYVKEKQGNDAKIDLVELTGDMFMLSNPYHVDQFLNFFEKKSEEYGFKYTAIWGNHDRHGLYNPNWLSERFAKAKNCFYMDPEDDLYGRSNFVINLMNGDHAVWQLANLDSGASFSESALAPFRDYDYLRQDQTQWWLLEHEAAGHDVPTIAYYHIPQQDNLVAWNLAHEEGSTMKHKFFKLEGFGDNGNEEYASDFIVIGRANNLKAAFMGHAHNVDWTVDYDGVVLGLGVKTGPELYYAHVDVEDDDVNVREGLASVGITENFDLIGAALVTLTEEKDSVTGAFNLDHLYYNERETNDFVRWVNWNE